MSVTKADLVRLRQALKDAETAYYAHQGCNDMSAAEIVDFDIDDDGLDAAHSAAVGAYRDALAKYLKSRSFKPPHWRIEYADGDRVLGGIELRETEDGDFIYDGWYIGSGLLNTRYGEMFETFGEAMEFVEKSVREAESERRAAIAKAETP